MKELKIRKLFTATVLLGEPYTLGDISGEIMEVTPVIGGSFEGDGIRGKILNFGGDWGFAKMKSINKLNNRFLLRTDKDEMIGVETDGILCIDKDIMESLYQGEDASCEDYYFREFVRLSSGDERFKWLNERLAVSKGRIVEEGVEIDVYVL